MLPVLVSLGPVKIYSMGVALTLGLFLGLFYWWKLGRDEHWDEIGLFDGFFLGLIAFFIFGRLGYVALHFEDLGTVYRLIAFLVYPGISYAAGIAGSLAALISFGRSKEWDMWKLLDIAAVVLPLILFFGFAGSLLNGSNPGRAMPFGLIFPGVEGRRFPVDIWGMIWSLITFGVAVRVRKNFRFYGWYKGTSSVAKDGLAAIVTLGLSGFYALVAGFLDDGFFWYWLPVMSVVGLGALVISGISIYRRVGGKDKLARR